MAERKLEKGRPDGGLHIFAAVALFTIGGLCLFAAYDGYGGPELGYLIAAGGCFSLALTLWGIGQILSAISYLPGRADADRE